MLKEQQREENIDIADYDLILIQVQYIVAFQTLES